MIRLLPVLLAFFCSPLLAESGLKILLVVGSGGAPEFAEQFEETALLWKTAAEKGGAGIEVIGLDESDAGATSDSDRIREMITSEESPELWVVLVGHGTFDGRDAKFNVRGPDFSDRDLAGWLEEYPGQLSLINTASASGSFLREASKEGRVVITATKNEAEVFFTRFGRFFAEAISGEIEADLDNDTQVSLLEAFLYSSRKVEEFYKSDNRLATEHALLDDNGDAQGSRAEWYEGTTPVRTPSKEAKADGDLSVQKVLVKNAFERLLTPQQRQTRDALERQVVELRRAKSSLDEAGYYAKLEELLIKLAKLYGEVKDS